MGALRQGWTREKILWSCAWGVTVGVFPILGVTTAALAVIGHSAHLNHTLLQASNYLVGPLKWALILPCIRMGEWIFRPAQPFRLHLAEFAERFRLYPLPTLAEFGMTFVHAIVGWVLLAPLLLLVTHALLRRLLPTSHSSILPLRNELGTPSP